MKSKKMVKELLDGVMWDETANRKNHTELKNLLNWVLKQDDESSIKQKLDNTNNPQLKKVLEWILEEEN